MSILKLIPSGKDYLWGGHRLEEEYGKEIIGSTLAESWELSCHPDGLSTIANGEFVGKSLKEFIDAFGCGAVGSVVRDLENFPILVKLIDAQEQLSIQVHPNDAYAKKWEGQNGKNEMWYIIDAKEDSFLYYGFQREISKEEFQKRIEDDTLTDVLQKVNVHKGDCFFIEAGTIHAIGSGILLAEIQQSSNVTYRVYDYGRKDKNGKKRELHREKALEVTERKPVKKDTMSYPHLVKCAFFTVDRVYLDGATMKKIVGDVTEESFLHILILSGCGSITCKEEKFSCNQGESFFLSAGSGTYEIEGTCDALLTSLPELE